jgi:hypothetical protein
MRPPKCAMDNPKEPGNHVSDHSIVTRCRFAIWGRGVAAGGLRRVPRKISWSLLEGGLPGWYGTCRNKVSKRLSFLDNCGGL